jgi:hypothetical protein
MRRRSVRRWLADCIDRYARCRLENWLAAPITPLVYLQRLNGSFKRLGLLAACAVSWTCSVYDTDLVARSEPTAGGPTTEAGGATTPTSAGTNQVEAGATSGAGGASTIEGPAGQASTNAAGVGGSSAGSGPTEVAGGDGGTGGDGNASLPCAAAPIPLKGSWHASASHSSLGLGEADNKPEYVMDLTSKQWSTGKAQSGDEWLQVDFGVSAQVRELTLTLNSDDAEDYPRIYQVKLSDTPLDFNARIRASGAGSLGQALVVTFAEPVKGRYLLVQQKGRDTSAWWSVSELTAKCF